MPKDEAKLPSGLFLEGPPIVLPVRATGSVVMDVRGQTIANCPNSSLADVVAYSINVFNGVHPEQRSVTEEMLRAGVAVLKSMPLMSDSQECHLVYEAMRALDPEYDSLKTALDIFQSYGCPACSGDCAAANPPVTLCPMRWVRDALAQTQSQAQEQCRCERYINREQSWCPIHNTGQAEERAQAVRENFRDMHGLDD